MLPRLSPRRRLPVLKSQGDDSPPRPRWQWVGFGTLAILLAWLPLTQLSALIVRRVVDARLEALEQDEPEGLFLVVWLLPMGALLLSGALGGYVLSRWGERCGWREAAVSGALVAVLAIGLSWARFGVNPASVAVVGVVVPGAVVGAILGGKRRRGGLL